jgi:hypothetical protein
MNMYYVHRYILMHVYEDVFLCMYTHAVFVYVYVQIYVYACNMQFYKCQKYINGHSFLLFSLAIKLPNSTLNGDAAREADISDA